MMIMSVMSNFDGWWLICERRRWGLRVFQDKPSYLGVPGSSPGWGAEINRQSPVF
jgi:hypothetical protein